MGPLHGVKVIEMGGLAPGPFCAMMLADMGAQVLRVERPGPRSTDGKAYVLNRNRRAIALDLKSDEGRDLMLGRLIPSADALVEGFRPRVMERLGLGPGPAIAANPKLVYGRMTGWGQDGPLADTAGHDINYIALTGVLHSIGRKDGPPVVPLNLVGDFGGGGMYLAFGIVCALFDARSSGKGQVVDAAMVDGAASLMAFMFGKQASRSWSDVRGENPLDGSCPWYGVYETSDGQYVSVGAIEPQFYSELLRCTGLDQMADLPERDDRARWPDLAARFAAAFREKTRDEWIEFMGHTNACVSPVLTLPEAVQHPHMQARETFLQIDGVVQPAPAPRFSRTLAERPFSAVDPGVDDAAALAPWGFSRDEVARLQARGVIGR